METFFRDLKYSLRTFRQSPSFTIAAVAALALGIGANTAIFSVVNAVLLKPVPFPDPDRLVMFMNTSPQGSGPGASPAKFQHWRQQTDVVEDVAAFRGNIVNYTGGDLPQQLTAGQVSADYFRLFGAPIVRGRAFTPDEDLPNGNKVAVLSHGLWMRRFGGDPEMLGKTISLSGDPHVVVGIVGPTFDVGEFGTPPDLWIPFQLDPNTADQGHYFQVAGRLKEGVPLNQAKARVEASADEYRRKYANALQPNSGFSVERFQEAFVSNVRPTLLVLAGAVSLVLLIACANVANLLLVRATGRKREFAIRSAIGAGRGRIVRQLLTESVVLSTAGGALGLALGVAGIRALLSVNTAGLPRLGENGSLVGVDWRVLGFTLLVSVGTGVLFGLIPALQGSRTDLSSTLKESGGRTGTGFRHNKARSLLVVSEVTLALILLIGSALLIRTSLALGAVNTGFDPNNVLTMRMSLTGPQFLASSGVDRIVRDGVERLRALPGVEQASATCCVPLEGGYGLPFAVVGRPLPDGPFHGGGGWLTVSPGYFEVFKIPVKRGRTFTDRDAAGTPPVVVINEAMAKEFWKDGDPLNDRLVIGRGIMREFASEPDRQIIGVVSDVRDRGLNNDPGPTMYVPQAQVPDARQRPERPHHACRVGGPHPRRAPFAERAHSRTAATGERLTGVGGPVDGRRGLAIHLAPAVQHAADDDLWRLRAPARRDRHLWIDGVLGRAADAGDRHPAGAGREVGRHPEDDRLSGHAPRCRRRFHRDRVRLRTDALHRQLSVWREGLGSGGIHQHSDPADGGCPLCRLVPGRPREPCGSNQRAPLRIGACLPLFRGVRC